jgi:hypothetical protein
VTAPRETTEQAPVPDDGLRKMMIWVLVALLLAVAAAALMARLAVHLFDTH